MGFKPRDTPTAPDDGYPAALPHGAIEEVFPDVFFVTGTVRPVFAGETWQFSRNMTIVREDGALTLINAVRLDDEGLAALEALGTVEHVVKIGAFHGMDDAFYVDHYDAILWALPKAVHESGKPTDRFLGDEAPFRGCSVFTFETASHPEALLIVDRAGGIVIACDSLQNWAEADRFFAADSAEKMLHLGFIKPAQVGPGWRQACAPGASDFRRLEAIGFRHLLSAHGAPLRDTAHADLSANFRAMFPA